MESCSSTMAGTPLLTSSVSPLQRADGPRARHCGFCIAGLSLPAASASLPCPPWRRAEGYEVVLLNSNPATIMTDPGTADRTYVGPMTPELVEQILEKERPDAILPTMGGQTALNLAKALSEVRRWSSGVGQERAALATMVDVNWVERLAPRCFIVIPRVRPQSGILEKYNVELIGAKLASINKAEDRELFANVRIRLRCAHFCTRHPYEPTRSRSPACPRRPWPHCAGYGQAEPKDGAELHRHHYGRVHEGGRGDWSPAIDHPPGLHPGRDWRRHCLQHGRVCVSVAGARWGWLESRHFRSRPTRDRSTPKKLHPSSPVPTVRSARLA